MELLILMIAALGYCRDGLRLTGIYSQLIIACLGSPILIRSMGCVGLAYMHSCCPGLAYIDDCWAGLAWAGTCR